MLLNISCGVRTVVTEVAEQFVSYGIDEFFSNYVRVTHYRWVYSSDCDLFFFSSRRRHTRYWRDWSSDVCSSDLSGDQLGKPVLAGPRVRSRASEPSARTIMTRAGLARGTKKEPTPNTIHLASGDHSAENAMLPSSWKMRLLLAPSESITASAVSIPGRSLRSLSTSDFPSREKAGKISE